MKTPLVILNAADNVATALVAVERGQPVTLPPGHDGIPVVAQDDVAFGHKVALVDIENHGDIIKYGEVIGRASRSIAAGEWVHTHNVEAVRARGDIT